MEIDEGRLATDIEESRDLHADVMRAVAPSLPALAEIRRQRRGEADSGPADPGEIDRFNAGRRRLVAGLGLGVGRIAAGGGLAGGLLAGGGLAGGVLAGGVLAGGGLGALVTAILATPARADRPLDVQILQTASSLERLLVDTYGVALGKGPLGINTPAVLGVGAIAVPSARELLTKFLDTTYAQHDEHRTAFQTLTSTLGGKVQDAPNPKFAAAAAGANLGTPVQLLDYAVVLEKIVTDTYLLDLSLLEDVRSKERMAAVMGVEAQHLASLKSMSALFKIGNLEAVKVPVDVTKLPAAFGSLAFPDALHKASESAGTAQPESGAVA